MNLKMFLDLILFVYFLNDVHSIQVSSSVSPQIPVLGDNVFRLECTFTLLANPAEQLQGLTLQRKRLTDQDFQNILVFNPLSLNVAPTYIDTALETRTTVTWPDTSLSTSATLTFKNTLCNDIADYKWVYTYFQQGQGASSDSSTTVVNIKVAGSFTGQSDYGISFSPAGYDVTEGDNITFTCKADIGRTPQGNLAWYYYMHYEGYPIAQPISNQASKDRPEVARTCSQSQRSVLVMTMRRNLNKYLVRCTLQQDVSTPDGDDHRQTEKFNVKYSPRNTAVNSNPAGLVHTEGQESLTLMCVAHGNPDPTYSWLLPNGTEVDGQTLQMSNLQLNDTGNYTCQAKNGIPDANFTVAKQVTISVVQVTIVELQKNGKIINTDTVEVDIGRPTTLGCNIIPSNNRPPSTVTWYIGSTVKQQSPSTSYTVTATKTDNGKIIYCKVYNLQSESQAVESSRAKLLVRVPVPNVQLDTGNLPVSDQTLPVTAGTAASLRCIPGFSRPSATIDWYIQSSQQQSHVHTQKFPNTEYILTADIDNHLGQIFCQAYIPGQVPKAESAKLTLFVNDTPSDSSVGAIAGGVTAGVLVIIIILASVLLLKYLRRKGFITKRKSKSSQPVHDTPDYYNMSTKEKGKEVHTTGSTSNIQCLKTANYEDLSQNSKNDESTYEGLKPNTTTEQTYSSLKHGEQTNSETTDSLYTNLKLN